jgi:hypothetical protein
MMECETVSSQARVQGASCVAEEPPAELWRASFSIGEVSLGISGAGALPVFGPQLDLFRSESTICESTICESTTCDLEIGLQWADRLFPPSGRLLFDSGAVWTLYEDGDDWLFDFASDVVGPEPYKRLHVDREFRRGRILLNKKYFPDSAPCCPLDYPLDELVVMHRLGRERGVEVHAAGIRDAEGNGYLFLGHSGAGKSTTTRLWNQLSGMTVLSDDRIILRQHYGHEGQAEVWMYGTPWHGEAAFAAPEKARIERLFVIEHAPEEHAPEHAPENRITPINGTVAVGEIMARSFLPFHDAPALENTMSFLQEMVAVLPCYRLEFRPDSTAVEAVRQFRS